MLPPPPPAPGGCEREWSHSSCGTWSNNVSATSSLPRRSSDQPRSANRLSESLNCSHVETFTQNSKLGNSSSRKLNTRTDGCSSWWMSGKSQPCLFSKARNAFTFPLVTRREKNREEVLSVAIPIGVR